MFEKIKQILKEKRDQHISIKFSNAVSLKELDWEQVKQNTDGSLLYEKISLKGLDTNEEEN